MVDRPAAETISKDIERVVVPRERIARRVEELASQIAGCYGGEELTILAVLTGSLIFLADLIRQLPIMMRLNVVSVCSYPGQATASQGPQFDLPVPADLAGRNVLVLDDILDSGRTLKALLDAVAAMCPASLRTCVLLKKDRPDLPDRPQPDFAGFQVPNEFLVGYGLDFDNLYRNLPDVCVLRRHAPGPAGETTP